MRLRSALSLLAVCILGCRDAAESPTSAAISADRGLARLSSADTPASEVFFGSETFVRGTGAPTQATRVISLAWHRPPYRLTVVNGSGLLNDRVSSGTVKLGGVAVLGPSDFSRQFAAVTVPVTLSGPSSTLEVTLNSKPGSKIAVSLEGQPIPVRAVSAIAETARATTAVVTPQGGEISATGSNGVQYRLVVPAGALRKSQSITLTPAASLGGLRPQAKLLAAVELGPDGLELLKLAELQIVTPETSALGRPLAFGFRGHGEAFHYVLSQRTGRTLVMPVAHFSGAGAVADKCLLSDDPALSAAERAVQTIVCALYDSAEGETGGLEPQYQRVIEETLLQWYDLSIRPVLLDVVECAKDLACIGTDGAPLAAAIMQYAPFLKIAEDPALMALLTPNLLTSRVSDASQLLGVASENWLRTLDKACADEPSLSVKKQWLSYLLTAASVANQVQSGLWDMDNSCGGIGLRAAQVVVLPVEKSLLPGQTHEAVAFALNAFGQGIDTATFSWASDKPAVATVSTSGMITAVGAGVANIKATKDGVSGSTAVTVLAQAPSIASINPATLTVPSSGVQTGIFRVTGSKLDDATLSTTVPQLTFLGTPAITNGTTLEQQYQLLSGAVSGAYKIVVTTPGGSAEATISLTTWRPARVVLSRDRIALRPGQSASISAVMQGENGVEPPGAPPVTWSSSNERIASVSPTGTITANSSGWVSIRASMSGISAYAVVAVRYPTAQEEQGPFAGFWSTSDPTNLASSCVVQSGNLVVILKALLFGSYSPVPPYTRIAVANGNRATARESTDWYDVFYTYTTDGSALAVEQGIWDRRYDTYSSAARAVQRRDFSGVYFGQQQSSISGLPSNGIWGFNLREACGDYVTNGVLLEPGGAGGSRLKGELLMGLDATGAPIVESVQAADISIVNTPFLTGGQWYYFSHFEFPSPKTSTPWQLTTRGLFFTIRESTLVNVLYNPIGLTWTATREP